MLSLTTIMEVIQRSSQADERRARYTVYVSWVLLPVVLGFPFLNDYGDQLATVILAITAIIAMANVVVYHTNWQRGKTTLPYLGASVAATALLYFAYLGYGGGASVVWIYVFPLLVMFMLGIFWGLLGCILVIASCLLIMTLGSSIGGFDYSNAFIQRFGFSFGLVSALALGFEYWRVALEIENESMIEELHRTRIERDAFAELAKVCAWCSSVKTPEDEWLSIEAYVSRTEDKAVSHSICPECELKQKILLKPE